MLAQKSLSGELWQEGHEFEASLGLLNEILLRRRQLRDYPSLYFLLLGKEVRAVETESYFVSQATLELTMRARLVSNSVAIL